MTMLKQSLPAFILGACLFALGACDSKGKPAPDAGTDVDAGSQPVIPEGYTLMTPSDTEPYRAPGASPHRWAFVAEAGKHYDLFGAGLQDCGILLRDSSGTTLEKLNRSGDPYHRPVSRHWSGLTGGAVYTLELDTSSGCRGEFYFVDRGPDDYGDMLALVTPSPTPGQAFTGISEHPGELDLASFDTVAGHVYSLDCTLPVTPVIFRPTWTVGFLKPDGTFHDFTEVASVEETNEYSSAFKATGDMALVYVTNNRIAESPVPYSCMLRDMGVDDYEDTVESATALAAGTTSVQGMLGTRTDTDAFSLPVTPHHIYRVSCDAGSLHACDVSGRASTDTGFMRSMLGGFKASQPLQHLLVRATRKGQLGWLDAHYTLQFEDLGEDDHGDTLATATPLTGTTQQAQGRISVAADEDFFSFTATEGWHYRIQTVWADGAAQNPLGFAIQDEAGQMQPTSNEPAGPLQEIRTFTAPKSGTYFIRLVANWPDDGDYTLQFDALAP